MAKIWDILTLCAGYWGGVGGVGGGGYTETCKRLDGFRIFDWYRSCLFYCFSVLCLTSIKISSILFFAIIARNTHQGEHLMFLFTSLIGSLLNYLYKERELLLITTSHWRRANSSRYGYYCNFTEVWLQ